MKASFPILLLILAQLTSSLLAQEESYNFTSGPPPGDDFSWPSQINDTHSLDYFDLPYEGLTTFYNETNNPVMFGSNYLAAGNSNRIDSDAMWGNPRSGPPLGDPYLDLEFYEFLEFDYDEEIGQEFVAAGVTEISFDFAWATSAGSPSISTVVITIFDYDGNGSTSAYPLSETFNHGLGGSGIGREGRITLNTGFGLSHIACISIDLTKIAPPGQVAEFAIDNMEIYMAGGGGGIGPGLQEVYPVSAADELGIEEETDYGTNVLKGIGLWGFEGGVRNNSGVNATFSSTFTSPDPELYDPSVAQHTNQPIAAGEIYYPGVEWEINTDTALSGEYSGSHTVINHSDPNDPDNTFDLVSLKLYDPPILSDNTTTTIDPAGANQLTISNAAVEPHAGALRASVEVQSIAISDPRFSLTGIVLNDLVDPGQALAGTLSFDSSGLADGVYTATLTIGLEMTTPQNYLNRSEAVPDRVWTLQATVGTPLAPPEAIALSMSGGTVTITYQSIPGEAFAVKGTTNFISETDLPDTVVGDGTVKTYTHTPPPNTARYFYRLLRNP